MNAIVIVVSGSKRFRVQTMGTFGGIGVTCNLVNDCPTNWVDIDLSAGDILYVPKHRGHIVFTTEPSLSLSFTFQENQTSQTNLIGATSLRKVHSAEMMDAASDNDKQQAFPPSPPSLATPPTPPALPTSASPPSLPTLPTSPSLPTLPTLPAPPSLLT